ncbi:MAG: (2Fe-2S)-binding protein [Thermodesulfobacteriota bacterium]
MKRLLELKVNGESYQTWVADHKTLLDVLRDTLALTGTKKSCDQGECGSCTVILNGKPVLSCLVLAREAEGKEILTIEGLAQAGQVHPLQKAFVDLGAIQCGYCTPGMIMTAKALLDRDPRPNEHEIKEVLAGNLCRCGCYPKIVEAIKAAAQSGEETFSLGKTFAGGPL